MWTSYEKMSNATEVSIECFVFNCNYVIPHCSLDCIYPFELFDDTNLMWVLGEPILYWVDASIKEVPFNLP